MLLGYAAAADSVQFMSILKTHYQECRERARQAFEKNDSTAAYWTGRADTYEAILDNCEGAKKAKLKP